MPFDFAPPTKILMRIKENTVAEKLFIMPGCSAAIQNNYFIRVIFHINIILIFLVISITFSITVLW